MRDTPRPGRAGVERADPPARDGFGVVGGGGIGPQHQAERPASLGGQLQPARRRQVKPAATRTGIQREPPRVCWRLFGFELRCHGLLVEGGIVAFFGLGWRDIANRLEGASDG